MEATPELEKTANRESGEKAPSSRELVHWPTARGGSLPFALLRSTVPREKATSAKYSSAAATAATAMHHGTSLILGSPHGAVSLRLFDAPASAVSAIRRLRTRVNLHLLARKTNKTAITRTTAKVEAKWRMCLPL